MEVEAQLLELRLRLEEQEVRRRHNAVRIKDLPETQGREDLLETLQTLFEQILEEGDPSDTN